LFFQILFIFRFKDDGKKFPGGVHDATVFKESGIFKNHSRIIPEFAKLVGNKEIPFIILRDPAYPLIPRLLKPYTGHLTPQEESFNWHLSWGRIVVENAFGRLKGRWRCLAKRIDINYKFVPYVALACATLHNLVEIRKEKFTPINEYECNQQPPDWHCNQVLESPECDPSDLREHLREYIVSNFPLRSSSK